MGHTVSVLGASGYAAGELLRLLGRHPALTLTAAGASTHAGEPMARVQPHLGISADYEGGAPRPGAVSTHAGSQDQSTGPAPRPALGAHAGSQLVSIEAAAAGSVDVCFSCLPGGVLATIEEGVEAGLIVDLSDDFRSDPSWVYGLTEYARGAVAAATRIANPGCYPTATLLCLLPFAKAGLLGSDVVVDAISGYSGAGRRTEDRLLFASADENAGAYGSTEHRHVFEMERALAELGGIGTSISFTPHLVPMARGIVITARFRPAAEISTEAALSVLHDAYRYEPFVEVVAEWPQSKAVRGSNRAQVSARLDTRNDWVIGSASIDNLGKGAAGQALQNANLALGLEETAGLEESGMWP